MTDDTGRPSRHRFEEVDSAREWRTRIFDALTEFRADLRTIEDRQQLLVSEQHALSLSLSKSAKDSSDALVAAEREMSKDIADLGTEIQESSSNMTAALRAATTEFTTQTTAYQSTLETLLEKMAEAKRATDANATVVNANKDTLLKLEERLGFRHRYERPLIHGSQIAQWVILVILVGLLKSAGFMPKDAEVPLPGPVQIEVEE